MIIRAEDAKIFWLPNSFHAIIVLSLPDSRIDFRRQETSNFCHLTKMFIMGYWFSIWCCCYGRLSLREENRGKRGDAMMILICMTSIWLWRRPVIIDCCLKSNWAGISFLSRDWLKITAQPICHLLLRTKWSDLNQNVSVSIPDHKLGSHKI